MIKLFNTLTKKVDEFGPINDKNVAIYSCGPTVYDHIHIGNLSAFFTADLLRRTMVAAGYKTTHIMNITDVNDKIIDRGLQTYPELLPEQAMHELSQHYAQIFINDMKALGNQIDKMQIVYATDYIKQMQDIILNLYEKKFAYIADDGVYFSIDAYKKAGHTYGQLSKITSKSTSQARIDNDEYDKESAHDFALWKFEKPGEPVWDFEIQSRNLRGRPGWHIECSAMSTANLGIPFDIHTGGVDLIFPHHENEIAQSTAGAANGIYAQFFVHNEHILVDGKKMSKSLNNFYTLSDIIERGYDPLSFRLLLLQSHYRSQLNFSWANLDAAVNRLSNLRAMADNIWQLVSSKGALTTKTITAYKRTMLEYLCDDLNTPRVLTSLSELSDKVHAFGIDESSYEKFNELLEWLDGTLGLNLAATQDVDNEIKGLIESRELARQTKSWQKADEIRTQLEDRAIFVRDTERGPVWSRTT